MGVLLFVQKTNDRKLRSSPRLVVTETSVSRTPDERLEDELPVSVFRNPELAALVFGRVQVAAAARLRFGDLSRRFGRCAMVLWIARSLAALAARVQFPPSASASHNIQMVFRHKEVG